MVSTYSAPLDTSSSVIQPIQLAVKVIHGSGFLTETPGKCLDQMIGSTNGMPNRPVLSCDLPSRMHAFDSHASTHNTISRLNEYELGRSFSIEPHKYGNGGEVVGPRVGGN